MGWLKATLDASGTNYLFKGTLDDPVTGKPSPVEMRVRMRHNSGDHVTELCGEDPDGEIVQKKTPYDWCAVTDHAEYLGIMPMPLEKDNLLKDTEISKLIATGDPKKGEQAFQLIISSAGTGKPISYVADPKLMSSVWEKQKAVANKHNEPGTFTTLIAFEWTSIPMFQNLHHNVFFRDDKGPETIFSNFDSVKREDLWTYQEVQRAEGHENFSIPHNGNVSTSLALDYRAIGLNRPKGSVAFDGTLHGPLLAAVFRWGAGRRTASAVASGP